MIFIKENIGKFKLTQDVILELKKNRQKSKEDLEAGGILLGRFLKESNNIIVDEITTPMPKDIRKRNYYKRQDPGHQKVINDRWDSTNGTCNYIGEWHTHQENHPTPSTVDWKEWKRKLKADLISDRYMYFLIMGIKSIRIWEGDSETLKIKRIYTYEKE